MIAVSKIGVSLALAIGLFGLSPRTGFSAPSSADIAEGQHVFKMNCSGCHKWDGVGGGGYGGAALSLRDTALDRDQIITTVACGRIGTGMPYHLRNAYTPEHPCYGIASMQQVGALKPLEANNFLRPNDIAAVADYVLTELKGRGPPTLADCIAYWGPESRVCDVYRPQTKTRGKQG